MKKKLLAAAVVGALASPVAIGQTLYGIVDLGYQNAKYADGDRNKHFMVQGQHSGSRLGVRGSEDLAGGTYAMYQIEFNIQADNGDPAATGTQRLTFIGLGSKAWGEFTLGQQYTHQFHTIAVGSAAAYATFASVAGLVPELTRASNSFKYSSPVMGGFSVGALYSPSGSGTTEPTGAGADAKYWDVALRYTPGPFGVAIAHSRDESPAAAAAFSFSPTTGLITLGAATPERETEATQFSANWDNRAFGIYGNYWTQTRESAGVEDRDLTVWSLSGVARFGGRHEFYALWGNGEDDSLGGASEFDFWALVYQHVLSKRTRIYTGFAKNKNEAGAASVPTGFAVSSPYPPGTPQGANVMTPGYDPRAFQLGIVHTF